MSRNAAARAAVDGNLNSLRHDYVNHTAIAGEYQKSCGEVTPLIDSTPNLRVTLGLLATERRFADVDAPTRRRVRPVRNRIGDE